MSANITPHCEAINAAVFSSEMLFNDARRGILKEYIGRWQRAIREHEAGDAGAAEMINGLTEDETAATASVAGLTSKAALITDEQCIELAAALELHRALRIAADVAGLEIGGKDAAMPTPFHAGYQLACEEVIERLRTEVHVLQDGLTLPQCGTLPSTRQPGAAAAPSDDEDFDRYAWWDEAMRLALAYREASTAGVNAPYLALLDHLKTAGMHWRAFTHLRGGAAKREPMFYVRLKDDGRYEGPIHADSVGGKMLRDEKPGEWTGLYVNAAPVVPTDVQQEAALWRYIAEHWTNADFHLNKDAGNTPKSVKVTIKIGPGATGSSGGQLRQFISEAAGFAAQATSSLSGVKA